VAVDPERNEAASAEDGELTRPGAPVRTFRIEAREDLEIARQVRACLGAIR
jgi:acetate kinase